MNFNKVLLTQFAIPNFYTIEYKSNVHLAPGYLVGYVQKDFPDTKFIITPRIFTDLLTEDAFIDYAIEINPDLLLFSLYLWNIEKSLRIAGKLKRKLPNCKILFGGPEVNPDNNFLLNSKQFDFGIVGEGEIAFKEFLSEKTVEHIPGFLTKNSFNNSKKLRTNYSVQTNPYLANIIETKPDDTMFFETVRGCPFNCSFCYYNKVYDKIISVGSNHLEEIFNYARENNFRELFILDPTFNVQPNFDKILDKLITLNSDHHFKISTELRADFLTDEQINKLKKMNLVEAEIGLQTTNDDALEKMKRNKCAAQTIERTKKMLDVGIECKVDLIVGLPGDTLETFKKSIDDVRRANIHNGIQVFRLSILSGTDFSYKSKELGLISQTLPPYYLQSTPMFSEEDIKDALDYTENLLDISLYPIPPYLLSTNFKNITSETFVEFDSDITPIHKLIFKNLNFDELYLKNIKSDFCESLVLHFIVDKSNLKTNEIARIISWFKYNFPHNIYQFILDFQDEVDYELIDSILKIIPHTESYLSRDALSNLGVDLNLTASLATIVPHKFILTSYYKIIKEQCDIFIRISDFKKELLEKNYDEANFFFSGICQAEAFKYLQSNNLLDDYTLFDDFLYEMNKNNQDLRIYYPNTLTL